MCEVVNLTNYKKKKRVSGTVKSRVIIDLPDDISATIIRIKASIKRIDNLMDELGVKK